MKREIGIIKERLLMSVRRIIITGLTSDRTPNIFRASGRKVGPLTAEETIRQRRVPPIRVFDVCPEKWPSQEHSPMPVAPRRPVPARDPARPCAIQQRPAENGGFLRQGQWGRRRKSERGAEEKQGRIGTTCTRAHATTNSRGRTRTK